MADETSPTTDNQATKAARPAAIYASSDYLAQPSSGSSPGTTPTSERPTTSSSRPTTASTFATDPSSRPTTASDDVWDSTLDDKSISAKDLSQIWSWNATVPTEDSRLVQQLIAHHVQSSPDAPALECWDGKASYQELDAWSSSVAARLQELGVRPGTFVPLFFGKSMWMTVAFLAVIKAGGAGVLLEKSQPLQRLRQICEQIEAKVILCSPADVDTARELALSAVAVDSDVAENIEYRVRVQHPEGLRPEDPVVVPFTSGSSGIPKGAVMTHANVCSQVKHQQTIMNFSPSMRIYDFASYAFDVAYITILDTLCAGGCICVPSDADRNNDVEGSFERLKANYLIATPTVIRTLSPEKMPGLKTLGLGGEFVTLSDIRDWLPHVEYLVSGYGPAECTWTSTALHITSSEVPLNIGHGVGQNIWIVDPDNSNVLCPIGSEGELVVEGPLVGAGYIGNEVANLAFLQDPPWLLQGCGTIPGRRGRLYKTGDIVRYDTNGSLWILGRKDVQVKIRGQRVELEEVEFHVRSGFDYRYPLVAEIITPQDSDRQMLVVFMVRSEKFPADVVARLKQRLEDSLPRYMIPTTFIPVAEIPVSLAGKTNRRLLREMGAAMSIEELAAVNLLGAEVDDKLLLTPAEQQLGDLWAEVLGIDVEIIHPQSSFLELGGDSIAAVRLMQKARDYGFVMPATAILQRPILRHMVTCSKYITVKDPIFFENLETGISREQVEKLAATWNISVDNIETVLPLTHFQKYHRPGLEQTPQSWISWMCLDFTVPVDFKRLETACQITVARHDILRTVIVPEDDRWLQIVLKSVVVELRSVTTDDSTADCADRLVNEDGGLGFALGDLAFRVWFIQNSRGCSRFMMRLPHTHYDGSGAVVTFESITRAYDAISMNEPGRFRDVVHFKNKSYTRDAFKYWRSVFAGSQMTQIGRPFDFRDAGQGTDVKELEICEVPLPRVSPGVTLATVVNACWAATLAGTFGINDVIFSLFSFGRSADVRNVMNVAGPCACFLPLRVQFEGPPKASDVLATIHAQYSASLAYEHCDIFEVVEKCTDWPVGTHSTSILIIQTQGEPNFYMAGQRPELTLIERDWAPCPVSCFVFPAGDTLKLAFQRNSKFLDAELADRLCQTLAERLREFSPEPALFER